MAAADFNAIRRTIEKIVKTEMDNDPSYKVSFENVDFEPGKDNVESNLPQRWVQCLVNFGAGNYETLGGKTSSQNRITGVVVLNAFTPKGRGPKAGFILGKRLRDLYNRVTVDGELFFDSPEGPTVIAPAVFNGYFQTQVRVTFDFIEDLRP